MFLLRSLLILANLKTILRKFGAMGMVERFNISQVDLAPSIDDFVHIGLEHLCDEVITLYFYRTTSRAHFWLVEFSVSLLDVWQFGKSSLCLLFHPSVCGGRVPLTSLVLGFSVLLLLCAMRFEIPILKQLGPVIPSSSSCELGIELDTGN